jgi:hypothetical protein
VLTAAAISCRQIPHKPFLLPKAVFFLGGGELTPAVGEDLLYLIYMTYPNLALLPSSSDRLADKCLLISVNFRKNGLTMLG